MIASAIYHKQPLSVQPFAPLSLGAVRPQGWLREQLLIQAQGLSGHLAEIWPEQVGEGCAWLGGEGDAWERAPYYFDGLLPLAHLVQDARLIALADGFVDALLQSQREDGSFGPQSNEDWWPNMVACKVLMQQFTVTGDPAILRHMLKYYAYQYKELDARPLHEWAVPRAGEGVLGVLWLHALTGRDFLLKLARKLLGQGMDWTVYFHTFPFAKDMKKTMPWKELARMREKPSTQDVADYAFAQYHGSHVVNVAMGLKTPALDYALSGGLKEEQAARIGYARLMKHHGVASGMFTGDEHLSGNLPTQGTETCAVVETLFSLETLAYLTGEACHADAMEKIAFNALPAAFTTDMWGRQYVQQVNQVAATNQPRNWYNNGDDANMYSLEGNFGCCTANYHQGWPKFAASLWMEKAGGGLVAQSYAPCSVQWQVAGQEVKLRVTGGYPFGGDVQIQIQRAQGFFPILLRIPHWAQGAHCLVNGATYGEPMAGEYLSIERNWQGGDVIELHLPMEPRVSRWARQSAAVESGPLLYALNLPAQEEAEQTREDFPQCRDIQMRTDEAYNLALAQEDCTYLQGEGEAAFGKGDPPRVRVRMAPIAWKEKKGSADAPPVWPAAQGAVQDVELVPYGGTALRIAQFPMLMLGDTPTT